MIRILIGALVAMVLVASCAAEPEQGAPTTAAEDAASDRAEPSAPANSETERAVSDDGDQDGPEAVAPAVTASTLPGDPNDVGAVEAEDEGSSESPVYDPTVSEETPSELPEPGGPWIDPRQPDTTRIVPPPRR